jgi:hypothetical protein
MVPYVEIQDLMLPREWYVYSGVQKECMCIVGDVECLLEGEGWRKNYEKYLLVNALI